MDAGTLDLVLTYFQFVDMLLLSVLVPPRFSFVLYSLKTLGPDAFLCSVQRPESPHLGVPRLILNGEGTSKVFSPVLRSIPEGADTASVICRAMLIVAVCNAGLSLVLLFRSGQFYFKHRGGFGHLDLLLICYVTFVCVVLS